MRRDLTWLVPILLLAVAACEPGVSRATYLSQFIGSSETNLISALGVPTRSIESGGIKFLAYRDHRVDVMPGMPGLPNYGSPFGPYGYGGVYGGIPPQLIERDCETTFELIDNKVRSFTLRGNAC
jgi:hypothetical protein